MSADSASSPVSLLYASAIDVLIREYGYKESDIHYYSGIMGVPITFLDKYNPEQFEIIKFRQGNDGKDLCINGKCPYFRILIRRKPHEN